MKRKWMRLLGLLLALSMLLSIGTAAYATEPAASETEEVTAEPTEESATEEATTEPTEESATEEATAEPTEESATEEATAEPTEESATEETTAEPTEESAAEETTAEPTEESATEEATEEPTEESATEEATTEPTEEAATEETTTEPTEEAATEEATTEPTEETEPEETEPPMVITYVYEGDSLGRTGEVTIYHYPETEPNSGDAPVYFSGNTFTTQAEASAYIKSQMKQRAATISLTYTSSTELDMSTIVKELMDGAFTHTGVPTEGDYLKSQWGGWSSSASYSNLYSISITYEVTYYTTTAQEAEMDSAVANVLASLNLGSASDDQKVRKIYDYMCDNITYDYAHLGDSSYKLQYTAYAALINKTAVCQGYATLLYRLLLEVGVDCRLITGTGNGGAHAWNIIQLDGKYYNADVTWDAGRSSYSYYLKCPANFTDHVRNSQYDTASFHAAYPMSDTDRTYCVTHSLTYVAAKAATAQEAGNVAYWVCGNCGLIFLDSAGTQNVAAAVVRILCVYRLYNPYSGEHLLATSQSEISSLTAAGWSVDGILCNMAGTTPVYRLYNPYSGEHLYTMVTSEIQTLKNSGWSVDGVMAYSASAENGIAIYRLYNSSAPEISSHLLSTSQSEIDTLTAGGWTLEGVALYAAK